VLIVGSCLVCFVLIVGSCLVCFVLLCLMFTCASFPPLGQRTTRADTCLVRCIKPNDDKKPRQYNRERVAQQLTYTGVLETTRIRRDGFALRLDHVEFLNRCR
jgi:thiosulfate reductase cytochrome b subunit